MEDLNKITSTRVGDNIHFFVNGAEDSGTVVKMNTSFVTVVKDDGILQDIHINDTFFIKDILVNKTWNDMSMEERTVALHEIHAYSPRFLAKSWQQLPKELKDVMLEKSNVEQGAYGSIGQRPNAGINTNQEDDADDDYEGQTEDDKKEQFKHEELKPTTKSMQEQIWEEWLDKGFNRSEFFDSSSTGDGDTGSKTSTGVEPPKERTFGHGSKVTHRDPSAGKPYGQKTTDPSKIMEEAAAAGNDGKPELTPSKQFKLADSAGGMGDGGAPAQTSMVTGTTGIYNARYGSDGRIIGQGKDKDEEDKDDKKEEKKG